LIQLNTFTYYKPPKGGFFIVGGSGEIRTREEERQRELIQRWKPWEKSTGAKTLEGKAKSSSNAVKDGKSLEVRELIKYLNGLMREQKKLIEQ